MTRYLTREEEQKLLKRYRRTKDPRVEEQLVRSQLPLVASLARAHHADGIDVRDLIQEGALGLLQAIRRFEVGRGVRLSTYAAWWIRAYQYRYLLQNHRLVRVGTTQEQRRVFFRLAALRARLSAAGVEVTPERIAKLLGVGEDVVREMEPRLAGRDVSLDAPKRDGEVELRIDALVTGDVAADDAAAGKELAGIVRSERDRFRAGLQSRKRALFDARWMAEDPVSLQEMGERFGVTRERARQIEQKMLRELRERVKARLRGTVEMGATGAEVGAR